MNMLDRNREEALARAQEHSYYPDEQWAVCPGFPWYYVSNYGQIYSCKSERLVSPVPNETGHLQVGLVQGQWSYTRVVHNLVAKAFLEPDPELTEVTHIDGDYENNYVGNLTWMSRRDKVVRSFEHANWRPRNAVAVRVIDNGREMVFENMTQCAVYFGVSRSTVSRWLAEDRRRDGISIEFVENEGDMSDSSLY